MRTTGAELVVKALEDEGVALAFGIPGTHKGGCEPPDCPDDRAWDDGLYFDRPPLQPVRQRQRADDELLHAVV